MHIALIPQPKTLQRLPGFVSVPARPHAAVSDNRLFAALAPLKELWPRITVRALTQGAPAFCTVQLNARLRPDEYRLAIRDGAVRLDARSPRAAFHGLQTLRQICAARDGKPLPALRIADWPDFEQRGVYCDLARGRVPHTERLEEMIRRLAAYKVNHLQLYIEHTFRFHAHPDIGRGASPLTPDDVLRLDAVCAENFVELVPSLASFGHLATVLKHPRYRHMAEDWGVGKYVAPGTHSPGKPVCWTVSPAHPDTYPFLDSLFAEFLPLFRSDRFNVCCDETWDLGRGQTWDLCRRRGHGRVYLDHILKLRDLAARYGKRILFWGDIIRRYPDLIPEIPGDVTVLDWGYAHNHPFARIRDFRRAGLPFYACPGTNAWNALFPRWPEAVANIHGFAAAGKRNGAAGLLNTDWGDGGHYNFMELSWPGYLLGAEQAWNVNADLDDFPRRFAARFLDAANGDFAKAFRALGDSAQLQTRGNSSAWREIFFALPSDPLFAPGAHAAVSARNGKIRKSRLPLTRNLGEREAERLAAVRQAFDALARASGRDPHGILPCWIFAVDAMRHAARKLAAFGEGARPSSRVRRGLARELNALLARFQSLWRQRNRPSEMRRTTSRYRRVLRTLRA